MPGGTDRGVNRISRTIIGLYSVGLVWEKSHVLLGILGMEVSKVISGFKSFFTVPKTYCQRL